MYNLCMFITDQGIIDPFMTTKIRNIFFIIGNGSKILRQFQGKIHIRTIPLTAYLRKGSRNISDIAPRPYHPYFTKMTMTNTVQVVSRSRSHSISGLSVVKPLVDEIDSPTVSALRHAIAEVKQHWSVIG
jgi:hypothetical protein